MPNLLAISDLHVGYDDNRPFVEGIRPRADGDWLIVAGDVADRFDQIISTLAMLRSKFDSVVWVPGNHELWTLPGDRVVERGVARYERLIEELRRVDVVTPEDPYPVWRGHGGPVIVAPLFLLYDYTFRRPGIASKAHALAAAEDAGILSTDEVLLHPDPYPTRDAWCAARLAKTRERLDGLPSDARTVLVNHFPLVRQPTDPLYYPDFALWCGTKHTHDWPVRYRAAAVVYGHLHIPRLMHVEGVPHYEVSLGYPHEWRRAGAPARGVVTVLDEIHEG